jgi:hypothetical protein
LPGRQYRGRSGSLVSSLTMQRSQQKSVVSVILLLASLSVLAISLISYSRVQTEEQKSSALVEEVKGLITQKLDEESRHGKGCDDACLAKRRRIASQMKALQRQINSDYKNMISFGHKAGYVPPVKSIKQQVMDGSLLKSGDDAAAPPPFSPNLRSHHVFGESREKSLLNSEEPHRHRRRSGHHEESLSLPRVHSVDEMAHKFMHESDSDVSISHTSHDHISPHLAPTVTFHSKGHNSNSNSKWKKLFSFMDKGPHDEAPKVVKAPRTTIPSAVRRAIQRVSHMPIFL